MPSPPPPPPATVLINTETVSVPLVHVPLPAESYLMILSNAPPLPPGAVDCQVEPLEVNIFPEVLGATT